MDASAIWSSTRRSSASARRVDPEVRHARTCQTVEHVFAVLARVHQARLAKLFEVRAGELHADVGLGGKRLDRLLTLAQELDELEALGARNGLADACYLLVEVILQVSHTYILTTIRPYASPSF